VTRADLAPRASRTGHLDSGAQAEETEFARDVVRRPICARGPRAAAFERVRRQVFDRLSQTISAGGLLWLLRQRGRQRNREEKYESEKLANHVGFLFLA